MREAVRGYEDSRKTCLAVQQVLSAPDFVYFFQHSSLYGTSGRDQLPFIQRPVQQQGEGQGDGGRLAYYVNADQKMREEIDKHPKGKGYELKRIGQIETKAVIGEPYLISLNYWDRN